MIDNTPSDELFAQLDDIRIDKYTIRTKKQALVIEKLANSVDSETDELTVMEIDDLVRHAIEEMNAECPYLNELVGSYWLTDGSVL